MAEINLFPKFIDQAASPVAKRVGETLSSIWDIVFGGVDFYAKKSNFKREQALNDFKNTLDQKASSIPAEKVIEPDLHIIGPTLEASKYYFESESLRELFANLLISSMHTDFKNKTHPSFVEIVKQLSPDEAKMLKEMNPTSSHAAIGIKYTDNKDGYNNFVDDFSLLPYSSGCANPENGRTYLRNLKRLGLIEIERDVYFTNDKLYIDLIDHPFIQKQIAFLESKGLEHQFKKYIFRISELGWDFVEVCVKEN